MPDSSHLILPLLSSLLFVVGALFAKQATARGIRPFTSTAISNLILAICWGAFGMARGDFAPVAGWFPALWIAAAFVGGQLCTYLAFQFGDVSLATPIFGVKIILVAIISSFLAEKPIEGRIWFAAVLAAMGIAVIQMGSRAPRAGGDAPAGQRSAKQSLLTILLALTAATSLSLFDVGLQHYGRKFGAERFLTTMFVLTGVLSCGLLPWCDSPARVRQLGATRSLLVGAVLMAAQSVGISYALGRFGDATRVNIVYSLRGLWSVLLAWGLSMTSVAPEGHRSTRTMAFRLAGALLLTISVVVALL